MYRLSIEFILVIGLVFIVGCRNSSLDSDDRDPARGVVIAAPAVEGLGQSGSIVGSYMTVVLFARESHLGDKEVKDNGES